jgi:hypothetical protein
MAATASVEIGAASKFRLGGAAIHGRCLQQEALTISSSTATIATAVSAAINSAGGCVARIQTDDTACYVAVGITPDPTLTAASAASSARRMIPAGGIVEVEIGIGEKVAVKAVS